MKEKFELKPSDKTALQAKSPTKVANQEIQSQ